MRDLPDWVSHLKDVMASFSEGNTLVTLAMPQEYRAVISVNLSDIPSEDAMTIIDGVLVMYGMMDMLTMYVKDGWKATLLYQENHKVLRVEFRDML